MVRNSIIILFCAIFLVACGDKQENNSSDVIDRGLAAVVSNDLGKAEGIFESAGDDEKAQALYEQIVQLREGQKEIENGNIEEGKKKLELAAKYEGGSELITALAEEAIKDAEQSITQKEDSASTKSNEEKTIVQDKSNTPTNKTEAISDVASGMTYVQLANNDGNVREKPSIDSAVVHSGKFGDVFVYLQEKYNTSDGRTWYKVEYGSGSIGYVSRAVANLTNEMPSYVRLTENGTNIRSAPSIDASILYNGQKNDTFYYSYDKTYTKDGRTWLHIWLPNGEYGYVSQKVATMTTAYKPTIKTNYYGAVLVVTAATANIREYPSIDSAILLENISKGETFTYTGYSYDTSDGRTWYEVELHNSYGYISKAVSKIQ